MDQKLLKRLVLQMLTLMEKIHLKEKIILKNLRNLSKSELQKLNIKIKLDFQKNIGSNKGIF